MATISQQQFNPNAAPFPGQFVPNAAPTQIAQQPIASQQITAESAEDEEDPKKALNNHIKLLKDASKALFTAGRKLNRVDGKKLPGPDGVTAFTKTDLSAYQRQYAIELGRLKKLVIAAIKGKKRSNAGNSHLQAPFYVSRQIPDFFARVNLGYGGDDANARVEALFTQYRATHGDAEAERAATSFMRAAQTEPSNRVQDHISFYMQGKYPGAQADGQSYPDFFNNGLANSSMLAQLFRLYFSVNGLQSKTDGRYNNLNEEFNAAFGTGTNTHLILDGRDLTNEVATQYAGRDLSTLTKEQRELAEKIDVRFANMSGIDRLAYASSHPKKKKEDGEKSSKNSTPSYMPQSGANGTDAWGFAGIAGLSSFINFFRIPTALLSDEQRRRLTLEPAKEDPDQDRRSYAKRKVDTVSVYLYGSKPESAKAAKTQKGVLDAHNFSTHVSSTANAKIKGKQSRDKSEAKRKAEAASASSRVQFPALPQGNPSMIPSGMFVNMPASAPAPQQWATDAAAAPAASSGRPAEQTVGAAGGQANPRASTKAGVRPTEQPVRGFMDSEFMKTATIMASTIR